MSIFNFVRPMWHVASIGDGRPYIEILEESLNANNIDVKFQTERLTKNHGYMPKSNTKTRRLCARRIPLRIQLKFRRKLWQRRISTLPNGGGSTSTNTTTIRQRIKEYKFSRIHSNNPDRSVRLRHDHQNESPNLPLQLPLTQN